MEIDFNLKCWLRHDYELIHTCDKRFSSIYNVGRYNEFTREWTIVFYECNVCGKRHAENDHPDGTHQHIKLAQSVWKNTGVLPYDIKRPASKFINPRKVESMLQAALGCDSDSEANNFLMMARKLHKK